MYFRRFNPLPRQLCAETHAVQEASARLTRRFEPSPELSLADRSVANPLSNVALAPRDRLVMWTDACREEIKARHGSLASICDRDSVRQSLLEILRLLNAYQAITSGKHPDIKRLQQHYQLFECGDREQRRCAMLELREEPSAQKLMILEALLSESSDVVTRTIALSLLNAPKYRSLAANRWDSPNGWRALSLRSPDIATLNEVVNSEVPYKSEIVSVLSTQGLNADHAPTRAIKVSALSGSRDSFFRWRFSILATADPSAEVRRAARVARLRCSHNDLFTCSAISVKLIVGRVAHIIRKGFDDWIDRWTV